MSAEPLPLTAPVPVDTWSAGADPAGGRWAGTLREIHRRHGGRRLLVSTSAHAACAAADLAAVEVFGLPGAGAVHWVSRRRCVVTDLDHRPATRSGLTIVRVTQRWPSMEPGPAAAGPVPPLAAPDPRLSWAADLCRGHLDLVRGLLDRAVDHLNSRTLDGTPLLSRQHPQALIADAAMDLAEAAECLAAAANVAQVADIHRRAVAAGRSVIRLLGASGFVQAGPGGDLYAAELTCRLYLDAGADR